jgi:cytochrome c5
MGHAVWGNNTLGTVVGGDPTSFGQGNSGAQANFAQANTAATAGGATSLANKRMTGRSCQNCHSAIHGSNSPSGARFQR